MATSIELLVAYDISDHRERRRVAKLLLNWGFRWQKSVFHIRTHPRRLRWLDTELNALRIATGQILMMQLDREQVIRSWGQSSVRSDQGHAFVMSSPDTDAAWRLRRAAAVESASDAVMQRRA